MSAKTVLILCAQVLFVQYAPSQCTSHALVDVGFVGLAAPFSLDRCTGPLAYDGLAPWAGRGLGCNGAYAPSIDITPTSSGGLIVTSSSPVAPTGISVISDNAYEGILAVAGEVPFVGTTGMEGIVPTAGAAAVHHACGSGVNAMISEPTGYGAYGSTAFGPAIAPAFGAFVPAIPPTSYTGCGCGHLY